MGKYSGIFLCSDFDGTLAHQKQVPKANIDAIKYFCQNGGVFSVVSGRTFDFLMDYQDDLCLNSYVACVNGTQIFDCSNGSLIRKVYLPQAAKKLTLQALSLFERLSDITVFTDNGHTQIDLPCVSLNEQLDMLFGSPVYKLLIHKSFDFTDGEVARVKSIFGNGYEIARSWAQGLEISSADGNKGVAARFMADLVGAEKVICVGDYENDIPLLSAADTSYAVANALPSLKSIASHITCDVRDGAIAAVIADL